MNFGEKLQNLRRAKGMSQESLAEAVGVSRQSVSKWESGQSYPEMDKLIVISKLFGVSIDSMVMDKEEPGPDATTTATGNIYISSPWIQHYEYKSKTRLFNVPLVHINFGRGIYVAKGIIAIGNISIGLLSIGMIALGGLCLGGLALGIICFAAVAAGLLMAGGGIALGAIAMGGLAIGLLAMGGLAVGMFSVGGCAMASHVAIGGYASGHIAIGDSVHGVYTIAIQNKSFDSVSGEQVRELIRQEYPHLWGPVVDFLTMLFK